MDITKTEASLFRVSDLRVNEGQIDGVPANPRQINDADFAKLKKSLQASNLTGVMPLKVYEHNGEYIVLGGNMRLRALQELGVKSVSCIVVPKDTDTDTLCQIVIEDNSTFGEWDYDALANEWPADKLQDWGVDVPEFSEEPEVEEEAQEEMVNKSEVIIAGVSLFGQTGETIVCEEIKPEDAERLLQYVKENGAQGLIQKLLV